MCLGVREADAKKEQTFKRAFERNIYEEYWERECIIGEKRLQTMMNI